MMTDYADEKYVSDGSVVLRVESLERRVLAKISTLDKKIDAQFEALHRLILSQSEKNEHAHHSSEWPHAHSPHHPHHHHHHHPDGPMEIPPSAGFNTGPGPGAVSIVLPSPNDDSTAPEEVPTNVVHDRLGIESRVDDGSGSSSSSSDDDTNSHCSGSSMASSFRDAGFQTNDDDDEDEEDKLPVVLVESDKGMINPKKAFRMSWDIFVLLPFLVYLTVAMPFRLCFVNEPVYATVIYWFEFIIDITFIVDIIFNFFTGYLLEGDHQAEDGRSVILVEYDHKRVAWNYGTSWFVLDVVSGIPFALIEILLDSATNAASLKSISSLKLLRFLKLGRLLKLDKILSNLDRETLDRIEDFLNVLILTCCSHFHF